MPLMHATCVAMDGAGVLLRGPSGSGKSDLALRLIEAGHVLVADDQVALTAAGGVLQAGPPPTLAGRLEVRGVGIVEAMHTEAPVALLADLVPPQDVPRLPEPMTEEIAGVVVPVIRLAPFEASAPAKLAAALRLFGADG